MVFKMLLFQSVCRVLTWRKRLVLWVYTHGLLVVLHPAIWVLHQLSWHISPIAHTTWCTVHIVLVRKKCKMYYFLHL